MLYELRHKGGKNIPKNGNITAATDINFSNEKHKFDATGAVQCGHLLSARSLCFIDVTGWRTLCYPQEKKHKKNENTKKYLKITPMTYKLDSKDDIKKKHN